MTMIDLLGDARAAGVGTYKAEQVDRAAARFEEEKAKLYRSGDGAPIYAPEEMKEREAALLDDFDRAVKLIQDEAAKDRESGQQALAVLAGADPLDTLSGEDLGRASALWPFIQGEITETPGDGLAARIRGVLARGNRVQLVLYERAVRQRLDMIHSRVRARGVRGEDGRPRITRAEQEAITALAPLAEALAAAVADPKAAAKRATAEQQIRQAQALDFYIRRKRGEVDGSRAAALEAERRRMRAAF